MAIPFVMHHALRNLETGELTRDNDGWTGVVYPVTIFLAVHNDPEWNVRHNIDSAETAVKRLQELFHDHSDGVIYVHSSLQEFWDDHNDHADPNEKLYRDYYQVELFPPT